MRLIDADLMEWASPVDLRFLSNKHYKSVLNILCSQPTVDAIIPVYCKDCKWYTTEFDEEDVSRNFLGYQGLCNNIDKYMNDDDYCSSGKRKEDNNGE